MWIYVVFPSRSVFVFVLFPRTFYFVATQVVLLVFYLHYSVDIVTTRRRFAAQILLYTSYYRGKTQYSSLYLDDIYYLFYFLSVSVLRTSPTSNIKLLLWSSNFLTLVARFEKKTKSSMLQKLHTGESSLRWFCIKYQMKNFKCCVILFFDTSVITMHFAKYIHTSSSFYF